MDIQIRAACEDDAADIAGIYNHYVVHTHVTFETDPVPDEEMARRMAAIVADSLPWLVAVSSGRVIGYAYATVWNKRAAYRFSVESTIYLSPLHTGRGVGMRLYKTLVETIGRSQAHTVVAGIALPNEPSVGLHEKLGFRKVAHFEQVGCKHDQWVDVGYWQLLQSIDTGNADG
jgi:L-amino acid N-acyltransferase YncA